MVKPCSFSIQKLKNIALYFFLFIQPTNIFACSGGTSNGSLSMTNSYQTRSVKNGEYYTFNVTVCNTYFFTFCDDGGNASWDTELTLLDDTGTSQLSYSDDACGTQSSITWTANYT